MAASRKLVIGSGVVGAAAAYYLAKRGCRVILLDARDLVGSASSGNAGLITPGHPPIPRPGLVRQVLAWMRDPQSPLHIPIRLDPALALWLWTFRAACSPARFETSMRALLALGLPAARCIAAIIEDESIDCDYRSHGHLDVCLNARVLVEHGSSARRLREHGYAVDELSGDDLRHIEPAFAPQVAGAVMYRDAGSMDPRRFFDALVRAAVARGVELRTATPAQRIIVEDGAARGVVTNAGEHIEADAVVLAAGIWTSHLARSAGVRVPMEGGKGYHLDLDPIDPPLNTGSILNERFVAATPMGDRLRLAGTIELSGLNHRILRKRVEMLPEAARLYLPAVRGARQRVAWCGLRPCTADGLPVIGWAPGVANLFIATGHAMMGLTLGPLTGRIASECLLDDEPSLDIGAFTPARFARGRRRGTAAPLAPGSAGG